MLFLKIVLGSIVAILALGALFIGAVVVWFKRISKQYENETPQSLTIHLHEDVQPDWIAEKKVRTLIEEFAASGFAPGKAYYMEEMPGLVMLSLFHEKYCAVVYCHDMIGIAYDIAHLTSDEQYFTVSSMPTVDNLESPPNLVKMRIDAGTPIKEALAISNEHCGHLTAVVLNDNSFRQCVESYYKKEQRYRARNGGMTYEEYVKCASSFGDKHSDKLLQAGFIESKVEELELWNDAAVNEFQASWQETESDEDLYRRLFIVPEKTDAQSFVHFLSDYDIVLHEHVEKIGRSVKNETNIPRLFDKLNSARSPGTQAKRLGMVDFPVAATIYEVTYAY